MIRRDSTRVSLVIENPLSGVFLTGLDWHVTVTDVVVCGFLLKDVVVFVVFQEDVVSCAFL